MSNPSNSKPLLDRVPTWLPLAIVLVSALAYTVRADGKLQDLEAKSKIYDQMTLSNTDRMARIETKIDGQQETLSVIVRKLDAR